MTRKLHGEDLWGVVSSNFLHKTIHTFPQVLCTSLWLAGSRSGSERFRSGVDDRGVRTGYLATESVAIERKSGLTDAVGQFRDLGEQIAVLPHALINFSDGVENRRMVAASELGTNLGQG